MSRHEHSARRTLAAVVAVFAMGSVGAHFCWGDPVKQDVVAYGHTLGHIRVGSYAAQKASEDPFAQVFATIKLDYDKTQDSAGAITPLGSLDMIDTLTPRGMAWMQTWNMTFNSGNEQGMVGDKNGNRLQGTVSDCPYNGYLWSNGVRQFEDDRTPWYVKTQHSGEVGGMPNIYPWPGVTTFHQLYDRPTFPTLGGRPQYDGLLPLLAEQDGTITFHSVLTGVVSVPTDDPDTEADEMLTTPYTVIPFMDVTWGMKIKYVSNGDFQYDARDLEVTPLPLTYFSTVAADVLSAFDQAGVHAGVEWKVNFVPEPAAVGCLSAMMCQVLIPRRRWPAQR
jgi:hypothetical protein